MKHGICPKCAASAVYRALATEGEGLTAGSYTALIELSAGKTQATLWLDTFICADCGYLELFVANPQALGLLAYADGWEKVPAAGA